MNNRIHLLYCSILLLIVLPACRKMSFYQVDEADVTVQESRYLANTSVPKGVHQGVLIFKVSEGAAKDVKLVNPMKGLTAMSSFPSPMSATFSQLKAKDVKRLIRPMGKYEGVIKYTGLDQWFVLRFDEKIPIGSAFSLMNDTEGVALVEYSRSIKPHAAEDSPLSRYNPTRPTVMPFNDPRLSEQWHYNNMGVNSGDWAVEGADINLFEAWKITTGKPNVIVCIVDGGLDVEHPDLKDNLWVNPGEIPNNGIDDDNNGFIDDINGYCFVDDTHVLFPDPIGHGTHVAGTVAARNNNGIGVCGVAGGDGSPNSGIRLMGASIFRDNSKNEANPAEAIVYGALNGATISQNSWGYDFGSAIDELPEHIRAAIDFFTDYAGTEVEGYDFRKQEAVKPSGKQRSDSPMKGGLMFFSAGNDNLEYPTPPASYERVIAVAAIGPNFQKAGYSTYGSFVDISAPGGDMTRYGSPAGVLSTMSPRVSGNPEPLDYKFLHGTSMATPHVSGVAALVLSKFGGPGYTNEQLRARILASILPVDLDAINPEYKGKLGVGTLDALAALTLENKKMPPSPPVILEDLSTLNGFREITLFWTVPEDPDDGQPQRYQIFYSKKEPLNEKNYTSGLLAGTANGYISGVGTKPGDRLSFTIEHLETDSKCYIALVAYDRWGTPSKPVFFTASTKQNNPAVITNIPTEPILVLDSESSATYSLAIEEPDGHTWNYTVSGDKSGVTHHKDEAKSRILLTFRPVLPEGVHTLRITLTDELMMTKSYEVPFRVVSVQEPKLSQELSDVMVGISNDALELPLPSYFTSQYYLKTEFTATSENPEIATVYLSPENHLFIIGKKEGKTIIRVRANNGYKETSTPISVTVTKDAHSDLLSLWPTPTVRDLHLWLNPSIKRVKAKVKNANGTLLLTQELKPNTDGIAKLDVRSLTPGSHILIIEADGRESVYRFLKQ